MELTNLNELVNRLVSVSKDYSRLANITKVTDDQFKRWVGLYITWWHDKLATPIYRNYLVQPISQLQYETVIKYIQAQNFSLVRPHAGVVFKQCVLHWKLNLTCILYCSIEDDMFSYILVAPQLLVYDYMPGVISTVDTCRRYGSCDVTWWSVCY